MKHALTLLIGLAVGAYIAMEHDIKPNKKMSCPCVVIGKQIKEQNHYTYQIIDTTGKTVWFDDRKEFNIFDTIKK